MPNEKARVFFKRAKKKVKELSPKERMRKEIIEQLRGEDAGEEEKDKGGFFEKFFKKKGTGKGLGKLRRIQRK